MTHDVQFAQFWQFGGGVPKQVAFEVCAVLNVVVGDSDAAAAWGAFFEDQLHS